MDDTKLLDCPPVRSSLGALALRLRLFAAAVALCVGCSGDDSVEPPYERALPEMLLREGRVDSVAWVAEPDYRPLSSLNIVSRNRQLTVTFSKGFVHVQPGRAWDGADTIRIRAHK